MVSRIGPVIAAIVVVILASCSGATQSNITPSNGSLTPPLPSQPPFGRSASPRIRKNTATETVLHTFAGSPNDGEFPSASLIDVNGALYAATGAGGTYGRGTVFSMTTSGAETVLHSFTRGHGEYPSTGLTNVDGVLYGATSEGGSSDAGTVFRITTTGVEKKLYSFAGGADGEDPLADLTNVNGTLYGTTYIGGGSGNCIEGCGTIFSITTRGSETVLHRFAGFTFSDGQYPPASLTNVNGTLYGITFLGGARGEGIVFSITTAGAYSQLHSFGSRNRDGRQPVGNLTNVGGKLYGTTFYGGTYGYGTVFRITTSGVERVLYSFNANGVDGYFPTAGLTNVDGVLYGTTNRGGLTDLGTVFKISRDGTYSQLYNFAGPPTDGDEPGSLIDVDGILYGTTSDGGVGGGFGTVYSLSGF